MKVATSRFGEIDVPDDSAISFPKGLVGFPETTEFVIFDCGEDGIFKWLQSTQRPEVAFIICEAHLIVPDYRIMIGQSELDALSADSVDEILVCLILTIPEDPSQVTANLLGPICFNVEKRVAMQLVLVNPEYSTRHRIFADPDQPEQTAGEGA